MPVIYLTTGAFSRLALGGRARGEVQTLLGYRAPVLHIRIQIHVQKSSRGIEYKSEGIDDKQKRGVDHGGGNQAVLRGEGLRPMGQDTTLRRTEASEL